MVVCQILLLLMNRRVYNDGAPRIPCVQIQHHKIQLLAEEEGKGSGKKIETDQLKLIKSAMASLAVNTICVVNLKFKKVIRSRIY